MKKGMAILAFASLVALGACKSRQAENVTSAHNEANVSENVSAEMNGGVPADNNAAAPTKNMHGRSRSMAP